MKDLFSLKGRTALVIGHAGNLGPVWIKALNEAGADTYAIGMPEQNPSNRDNPPAKVCDVTKPDDFKKFDHIEPDILLYNAAIDNPPDKDDEDGWDMFRHYENITAVNQFGAVNALRHYIPGMVERGGGSIHLIGSIMGYGPPDNTNYPKTPNGQVWEKPLAYGTSKRAYLNMAQWITKKWGADGVRCTVAAFGPIDMGQLSPEFMREIAGKIPMRRFTTIDDLKRTIIYHAACENFAGQDTLVDGGYRER